MTIEFRKNVKYERIGKERYETETGSNWRHFCTQFVSNDSSLF